MPSAGSPRSRWNVRTAASVEPPYVPASSSASIRSPTPRRRCWTSRTASPCAPWRIWIIAQSASVPAATATDARRSAFDRRYSGHVRVDLLQHRVLAERADDPCHLLAVLEQHEGGDAEDAEPTRHLRVLVDVHLRHLQGIALVAPDLLDHRRDHVARDAPLRPEVDEDRCLRSEHALLEVLVRHVVDQHGSFLSSVRSQCGVEASCASASRNRSASIAALHPCPAAVTA